MMGNVMIVQISALFLLNFGIIIIFLRRDCKINKKSCYYRFKKLCKFVYQIFYPPDFSSSPDLYVFDYLNAYYPKLDLNELDVKAIQIKIDHNL